ncbi:CDP-alcohol phosphatidyltransferase family protein [Ferruginibacter sp. SUN002]|uniref:CDP-alcohol phosphatidyltransferase family protein n=1 Tax=Ferruginibacter sp. SUN002 TaxID=2937789 RepID=UPI003D361D7B
MKQIPNIFTLINLLFGCIAIVFALQTESVIIYTDDQFVSSFNIPEKLSYAALFLFAAALVDFLDGFVARLLNATSEMGKQLDSLSDVVSFGVAPGVILYQLLRMSFAREENGLEVSVVWLFPAFILSCAAAYRLAKFNLDDSQSYGFKGVPTPAVGLLVASFPLILHYGSGMIDINEFLINKWVLYALIVILSWLMVSNLPLIALKFKDYTVKNNIPKLILGGVALLSIIFLQWLAVPVIFIAYIILSLLYKNQN